MDVMYQGKPEGEEPPTAPDGPQPVARPDALWVPGGAVAALAVAASGLFTQVRYTVVLTTTQSAYPATGLRRLVYSNLAVAGVALLLGGWTLSRRPRGETPWWSYLAAAAVMIALLLGAEGAVLLVLVSHQHDASPGFRMP
jgi:hypothetical protein